jgi:hypothetical protein
MVSSEHQHDFQINGESESKVSEGLMMFDSEKVHGAVDRRRVDKQ